MPLEARTHQIALHPTWDFVVQQTTCPLQTDSHEEPFQVQEVVSCLQLAFSWRSELILYKVFPPEESYMSTQWPKELSRVTKSLTCVSACALVWCTFGIIAMFYFESLLKRRELRTMTSWLDSVTGRLRPWSAAPCLPGPQSPHEMRGGQHGLGGSLQLADSIRTSSVYCDCIVRIYDRLFFSYFLPCVNLE